MAATRRPVRIVTNIPGLAKAAADCPCRIEIAAAGPRDFARQIRGADLVVIDNDWGKVVVACLLRSMCRFRIVLVDLILRRPKSPRAELTRRIKRRLLARVDRFVFYFRDLAGYQALYGIGPDRSTYVPFKVNGWENAAIWPAEQGKGSHVLCAGRTLRDIDTFLAAMARTGLPGVLLQQDRAYLEQHGSREAGPDLPSNVRLVVDRTDDLGTFLNHIAQARILVVPRFRGDMAATGISTYLAAMALGTPVVISSGPGADDVLDDEALIVPPEDATALADAISRIWSDDGLREGLIERGQAYAIGIGGEHRLNTDILAASLDLLGSSAPAEARLNPATS
jgi:glycosyltransferase involved in cell wall biosynthesis